MSKIEPKQEEVSPDEFAERIFGGARMPGPLDASKLEPYLVFSTIMDIKKTLVDFDMTPTHVLRLHNLVKFLEIIGKDYLGDDYKEWFDANIKPKLPKKVSSHHVSIAEHTTTLILWFEKLYEHISSGINVRPEVPIEMRLIGRETYESMKIGEVEVSDTEEESAEKDVEEVGGGTGEKTGESPGASEEGEEQGPEG